MIPIILAVVLGGLVVTYDAPVMTTERVIELIPVGDVQNLAAWIYNPVNIRYVEDGRSPYYDDRWKSAESTIREQEGDCEDRAAVAIAVISKWANWKTHMIVIKRKNLLGEVKAHAVCGYESPDGRRGIIDGKVIESDDWGAVFEQTYYDEAEFVDNRGNKLNITGWTR